MLLLLHKHLCFCFQDNEFPVESSDPHDVHLSTEKTSDSSVSKSGRTSSSGGRPSPSPSHHNGSHASNRGVMRSRETTRPATAALGAGSSGSKPPRDASNSSVSSNRSYNGVYSARSYGGGHNSGLGNTGGAVFVSTRYSTNSGMGPYNGVPSQHEATPLYFPSHSQHQQFHQHVVSSHSGPVRDSRDRYLATYNSGVTPQAGPSHPTHQRPPPFSGGHNNVNNPRSSNSKVYRFSGGSKQKRKNGRRDNSQNRESSSSR